MASLVSGMVFPKDFAEITVVNFKSSKIDSLFNRTCFGQVGFSRTVRCDSAYMRSCLRLQHTVSDIKSQNIRLMQYSMLQLHKSTCNQSHIERSETKPSCPMQYAAKLRNPILP